MYRSTYVCMVNWPKWELNYDTRGSQTYIWGDAEEQNETFSVTNSTLGDCICKFSSIK